MDVFDNGVKYISDFGQDDLMPHFIYCGFHYIYQWKQYDKLEKIILAKMRKYGIQSSILTMLDMWRLELVTKEKAKKAYEGKLKNERGWSKYEGSVNDDLERFLINLQNQKKVKEEDVLTFFTPKLTNEEFKLVQEGNEEHLKTYYDHVLGRNPDVDVEEMNKSDSKSKYVHVACARLTIHLTLETMETEDKTEDDVSVA